MNRIGILLSALVFGAAAHAAPATRPATAPARAPEWTIDAAHTSVNFSVRHIFTQVPGTFDEVRGTIWFDPDDLAGSGIDVTIPVASINTRNARRDGHLKSPDFFDAERYPTMSFTSDSIVRVGTDRYVAHGRMTIRGVTRPLDLPFTLLGMRDHPMREGYLVAGATARTTLNRTDFGVGSGSWAETAIIGDEVSIEIHVEASRPK